MHRFEGARKSRDGLFEPAGLYWYLMIISHVIIRPAVCPDVGICRGESFERNSMEWYLLQRIYSLLCKWRHIFGKEGNTSNWAISYHDIDSICKLMKYNSHIHPFLAYFRAPISKIAPFTLDCFLQSFCYLGLLNWV